MTSGIAFDDAAADSPWGRCDTCGAACNGNGCSVDPSHVAALDEVESLLAEVKATVTPLHVERGRQMRQVVEHDVVARGKTATQATTDLAEYLGVGLLTVRLAIAIADEADGRVAS